MRKGGAYDRFIMMMEAFLERGAEVHCLSLAPIRIGHPSFHNHKVPLPFEIRSLLFARLMVLFLFPWLTLLIAWRKKIDLFVAFGSGYAFILTLPKLITRRPVVTFIRGDSTFAFRAQGLKRPFLWVNQWIEYIGLRFSDRILTVNQDMGKKIAKMMRRRKNIDVRILFNNIPVIHKPLTEDILQLRESYGIPTDGKVLITAGILNRGKNIEVLLRSLSKSGIGNLFLVVVGDGFTEKDVSYRNTLKELAEELNVDRRVLFTGWLEKEQLWRLFSAADLFVLPSLSEGMPNVMLEALGCDLPCMGSNIPGIRDILKYDELMFDPLNDRSLTEKLMRYFSDLQSLDTVKRLCQERKNFFTFDWKERVFETITSTPGLTRES